MRTDLPGACLKFKAMKGQPIIATLEQLTQEVCAIARTAGEFLLEEQKSFSRDKIEEKRSHDYVSYVDKESERRVTSALRTLLPQAGFVTEEGTVAYTDEQYWWVVDPLDGTTNFVHGASPYCVSIALRSADELLLGVVYDPTQNECFSAYKGGGAFLNGARINVSVTDCLDNAFLITELPYEADKYAHTAVHLLQTLYGRVAGIRMNGSAALAICHVAAGRIDGWLEAFIGKWDFSAAALIVLEAGGKVTDFYGNADFLNGHHIIATNSRIHENLQEIVMQVPPVGM